MYCVVCGVMLTDANQAGLVCETCHQHLYPSRPTRLQPCLEVSYCAGCGRPYRPEEGDASTHCCGVLSARRNPQ